MRSREFDADARAVVDGCEAFLSGRLAELVIEAGGCPRPWMWTNLLAHGTLDELRLCSIDTSRASTPVYQRWRDARAYLAGEIADLTLTDPALRWLQSETLVPLEELLGRQESASAWCPKAWAHAVLRALQPVIERRADRRHRP